MSKKEQVCRICWKKIRHARYRETHKAQLHNYFKQWYEKKGRRFRREKNYPKRNRRIYELYMDTERRLSLTALGKMFQLTPPRIHKIIKAEREKVLKDTSLFDKNSK